MSNKDVIPTKLLWVDLEMTGLDSSSDVILEVAAEITDFDFNPIASYEAVISQPEEKLAQMNEWCVKQHTKSGLIDRCRTEGRQEQEVVTELCEFVSAHFKGELAILAGNSIHNDRLFIKYWWPELFNLLHYRMLDVSSLKVLMQSKYGYIHEKEGAHRAYDDIHASIRELQAYLKWFKESHDS